MKFAWPWLSRLAVSSEEGAGKRVKLIVGLGNPGSRYEGTPHNIGFDVVNCLADYWQTPLRHTRRQNALIAKAVHEGCPVWLVQPLSYMNNSGAVVSAIMRRNGIVAANLLVVSDDVDLPLGRIRIKAGGGDGGHRGLRSVLEALSKAEFVKLKLGVGRNPKDGSLVDYVLTKFQAGDREKARQMVETAGAAVRMILDAGPEAAMNEYNAL